MKIIIITSLITILTSCSFISRNQVESRPPKSLEELIVDQKFPHIKNIKIGQGNRVGLTGESVLIQAIRSVQCRGKDVLINKSKNEVFAYLSVSYKRSKDYDCHAFMANGQKIKVWSIKKQKFPYRVEKLSVAKKHVDLSPKNVRRWRKEMKAQKKVYSSGVSGPLFTEKFILPLKSKITSTFGNRRIFNNKKDSWHSGTDFRAPTGTPIPVANRGKVVFAEELFFNGNTVIVDHGMNIFTMYCHLSKITATVGSIVPQGEIIGKAGSTGRSSGPHLHWGLKINHEWVSGIPFVENQLSI